MDDCIYYIKGPMRCELGGKCEHQKCSMWDGEDMPEFVDIELTDALIEEIRDYYREHPDELLIKE